ncbi:MAG: hypothetical protein ABSE08_16695 [Syntrophobacteraceae bacterium]
MATVERRISDLEARSDLLPTSCNRFLSSATGLAEAIREGRLRAAGGDPFAETSITREMMDDPVYGELYRLIYGARERVRNFREDISKCPGYRVFYPASGHGLTAKLH